MMNIILLDGTQCHTLYKIVKGILFSVGDLVSKTLTLNPIHSTLIQFTTKNIDKVVKINFVIHTNIKYEEISQKLFFPNMNDLHIEKKSNMDNGCHEIILNEIFAREHLMFYN